MLRYLKIVPLFLLPPLELLAGLYFMLYGGSFVFEMKAGDAEEFLDAAKVASLVVKDREGEILRDTPSAVSGHRALWVKPSDVSPHFLDALVAAEDRRFYSHGGVDPLAVMRALFQNVTSGRIVSGGSTITQQVVKVATGGTGRRTIGRKLYETAGAFYLERRLPKERILESYINWVVFGNMTRGVEAASRLYFGKPSAHLTLSEATALAALLRAPTAMNPYSHPDRLEERRAWILGRMLDLGMIGRSEHDYALAHPPSYTAPAHPFLAPHLVEQVLEKAGKDRFDAGELVTTIDGALQKKVEHLADKMIEKVRHLDITNAAVMVMDNHTGEILAYVGSSAYFDEEREGMNDGVTALRSPGSTLKPFIYAEAFDAGYHPSTVLADVDASFSTPIGTYKPRNYDGLYHGPVRLRTALGSSYNVPAVKLASELGTARVLGALRKAGLASLEKSPDHYGVAIAVGDGEVSLLELVAAYAGLAEGGLWHEPTLFKEVKDAAGEKVPLPTPARRRAFSPQSAYLVTHILSDPAARAPGFGKAGIFDFPFPVAVKTGTSNDYRDNWTVGYSSEVTVGVWVGNFSGKPMGNISGITGAGPLFHQVMKAAMQGREGRDFEPPPGLVTKRVCSLSGQLAGPLCAYGYDEIFIHDRAPETGCGYHVAGKDGEVHVRFPAELVPWAVLTGRYDSAAYEGQGSSQGDAAALPTITFPPDGGRYIIDPDVPAGHQKLKVHVEAGSGRGKIKLVVDGKPYAVSNEPYVFYWTLAKGKHTMTARGPGGSSPPVTFHVE